VESETLNRKRDK